MNRWRASYAFRIAVVTAVGALLRAAFIARQPLWRDEAFTALAVQHPLQSMLTIVGHDSAPPLVYLADRLVAGHISASPTALRLLPLLAGIAAIPVGAALGRRVNGDRGGLWAAMVCALLPTLVISSRDVRMYSLASAVVMAATLATWRFIERPTWSRWLICAGLALVAVQTEYFAIPGLLALMAAVVIALRPPPRVVLALLGGGALAAASLVPWFAIWAGPQLTHANGGFWVEPLGIKTIFGTLVQFFSGPPIDPGTPFKLGLQAFQAVAIAIGVLALVVVARSRKQLTPEQRRATLFLTISGVGGTVLLAAVSIWHPLFDARYASPGWGPLMVVVGIGISLVDRATWRASAAVLMGTSSLALSIAVTHPDTPTAVAYIADHLNGGTVDAAPSEYLLIQYYGDARVRDATHVVSLEVPWFWGTAVYPPGAVVSAIPPATLDAKRPILVVDEADSAPFSPPPGYHATESQCFTGTCVTVLVAG